MTKAPVILDLCGGGGTWSQPYADAGYDRRVVDVRSGMDVRWFTPPDNVHGILAAPPCTEFAGSGARWWADKPPGLLWEGLGIVMACLEIIRKARPKWWALENPVGRLPRYIGPWRYTFQPYEYGGWANGGDAYTKRTCIWGKHRAPVKRPVELGSDGQAADRIWRMGPGSERANLRSVTPPGFASAFFDANP